MTDQGKLELAIAGLRAFTDLINTVESRCMATDGDVTPTLQEMTEDELRQVWLVISAALEEIEHKEEDAMFECASVGYDTLPCGKPATHVVVGRGHMCCDDCAVEWKDNDVEVKPMTPGLEASYSLDGGLKDDSVNSNDLENPGASLAVETHTASTPKLIGKIPEREEVKITLAPKEARRRRHAQLIMDELKKSGYVDTDHAVNWAYSQLASFVFSGEFAIEDEEKPR